MHASYCTKGGCKLLRAAQIKRILSIVATSSVAPTRAKSSTVSNPLSAMTRSPCFKCLSSPLLAVRK